MRYRASEKLEIIRLVEQSHLGVGSTLDKLGIPKTTFYRWYDRLLAFGDAGLEDRNSSPGRVWNRIPDDVRGQIIDLALEETQLSPRELAVRFTDTRGYFVSEASVYRLLKAHDLITSPAFVVIKAADEFRDKTTAPNQLWQTDFTYLKVIGWGWFYLSTILDDYSRYIIACLSGLHPHPLGLEWAQTGYRGARHGCSRPRRSPIPAFATRVPATFPDDAACATYLEKARWGDGFACPHCGTAGEPFHFENRPGVLRCRKCRQNTGLTVGTVMERSHTPLNVWFWAAYLVASQTPGMSAVQFQRRLGLSRYETAFQILHKLRSGMVRPNQDRIGGQPKNHVEVDETWVGGRTRGEGRGVQPQGSRLLCHRGASSKAGHQARQPERRTLCRTRSARRRARP